MHVVPHMVVAHFIFLKEQIIRHSKAKVDKKFLQDARNFQRIYFVYGASYPQYKKLDQNVETLGSKQQHKSSIDIPPCTALLHIIDQRYSK
jgi:hypothetical protein